MMPPSDSASARGPFDPANLKPLRLHRGTARRTGGFEPDHVASFLAGLTAQYHSATRVFPSPLAVPAPAAARPPHLSP